MTSSTEDPGFQKIRIVLDEYLHVVFVVAFLTVAVALLFTSPLWGEDAYLDLAAHVRANPLDPFHPTLAWVPHPPLLWYVLAPFLAVPRLATLLVSAACIPVVFLVGRRLYGAEVARLSVMALVSAGGYLLYSLVTTPDGLLKTFMAVTLFAFLYWIKFGSPRWLLVTAVGFTLASLTKYTAAPILVATLAVWLLIQRDRVGWPQRLQLAAVVVVSSLPLLWWIVSLPEAYGNFIVHYAAVYNLFPEPLHLTIVSNLAYYDSLFFFTCGFPLIAWLRHRSVFDRDTQLLLAYLAIIALVHLPVRQRWVHYFQPMTPAIAIISARSLAHEPRSIRLVMLVPQLLLALSIPLLFLH